MTQDDASRMAGKPAIHPTNDVTHQQPGDVCDYGPDVEVPPSSPAITPDTSLDTLESSVADLFKPSPHKSLSDRPSMSTCFRHSGWWKIRRKVHEALCRTHQSESRIRAFATCGASSWVQVNNVNPDRYRIQCSACHDRMCTPCANVRARRIREAVLKMIDHKQVSFITLTLSGFTADLTAMVDKLYRSFRYLRSHPLWESKVKGGAAFLEVKWNDKAGRWHPHLHIIADAKYIPQAELSAAWRSITNDSYIVHIERVQNEEKIAGYVVKYATKPLNASLMQDAHILDDTIHALRGRRLCLCFGSWYGTPLSAAEDEELADDWEDAQGWHNLDPLDLVLARALEGALWATQLLDALHVTDRYRSMCLIDRDNSS
jgi:Replication protein